MNLACWFREYDLERALVVQSVPQYIQCFELAHKVTTDPTHQWTVVTASLYMR
jgi:hypothetical protein